MSTSLKSRVYDVLENESNDRIGRAVTATIIALILLNVVIVIIETKDEISVRFSQLFWAIEIASLGVFTVEYGMRLWSCTAHDQYRHPIKGRLKHATTPLALLDLAAVLPTYLLLVLSTILPIGMIDLLFLRGLRLFRVSRLFKLGRYSDAWSTIKVVFSKKAEELVITFLIGGVVLVIVSTLIYFAEHDVQPIAYSSIPDTMWWALLVLSTVGFYGDMSAVTPLGKALEIFIAVMGISLFALPAAILAEGFFEEFTERRLEKDAAQKVASSPTTIVDHISKAAALRDSGELTVAEFEEVKKLLLRQADTK